MNEPNWKKILEVLRDATQPLAVHEFPFGQDNKYNLVANECTISAELRILARNGLVSGWNPILDGHRKPYKIWIINKQMTIPVKLIREVKYTKPIKLKKSVAKVDPNLNQMTLF